MAGEEEHLSTTRRSGLGELVENQSQFWRRSGQLSADDDDSSEVGLFLKNRLHPDFQAVMSPCENERKPIHDGVVSPLTSDTEEQDCSSYGSSPPSHSDSSSSTTSISSLSPAGSHRDPTFSPHREHRDGPSSPQGSISTLPQGPISPKGVTMPPPVVTCSPPSPSRGLSPLRGGIATLPQGAISSYSQSIPPPQKSVPPPKGVVSSSKGSVSSPKGSISSPKGSVYSPKGSIPTPPQYQRRETSQGSKEDVPFPSSPCRDYVSLPALNFHPQPSKRDPTKEGGEGERTDSPLSSLTQSEKQAQIQTETSSSSLNSPSFPPSTSKGPPSVTLQFPHIPFSSHSLPPVTTSSPPPPRPQREVSPKVRRMSFKERRTVSPTGSGIAPMPSLKSVNNGSQDLERTSFQHSSYDFILFFS